MECRQKFGRTTDDMLKLCERHHLIIIMVRLFQNFVTHHVHLIVR